MWKTCEPTVWRIKEGYCIVLNTSTGNYYTLNATAKLLWSGLFDENKEFNEAVAGIVAVCNPAPEPEQVREDCRRMVAGWIEEGLVEPNNARKAV